MVECYWAFIDHIEIRSIRWNKTGFFPSCILLYRCTTCESAKYRGKTSQETHSDAACCHEQFLEASPTIQLVYCHLPSFSQTIQGRRTSQVSHYQGRNDGLIRDIFLRTHVHRCGNIGRPARTYLHYLCADTRCRLEDLPRAMDKRMDRDWLIGWVFWHIKLCWLFNGKSIFIQIISSI